MAQAGFIIFPFLILMLEALLLNKTGLVKIVFVDLRLICIKKSITSQYSPTHLCFQNLDESSVQFGPFTGSSS